MWRLTYVNGVRHGQFRCGDHRDRVGSAVLLVGKKHVANPQRSVFVGRCVNPNESGAQAVSRRVFGANLEHFKHTKRIRVGGNVSSNFMGTAAWYAVGSNGWGGPFRSNSITSMETVETTFQKISDSSVPIVTHRHPIIGGKTGEEVGVLCAKPIGISIVRNVKPS